ncbi:MAG: DUF481 domain-containing protein [Cyclobacteriaceae bacterium]|nr:DUF481 domain-containing protein [Cyclobacteriaceae bacterium]UYN86176.1 MAG: DUF481 domain-containing protein [Cyclobacteriaceae bacterium]
MKCTPYYIIVLLCSHMAVAQILNIEKSVLDRDTTKKFIGNINGNLLLYNRSAAADEPVEFFGFDFRSSIAWFPGKHRLSSISRIDYLKINEDPFLNTGYQHFRFDFRKDRKVHPEIFAQYQYDNFRGLDPRLLVGTGMRHRLYRDEHFTLIFSVGIMYESEKWTHPKTEEIIPIAFWKSTNYLVFRIKISEWADFNSIQYYQTAYDPGIEAFRHRYSTDVNLNTKLTARLQWTTSFILSFENRPIVPIVRTIYRFSNGITYKF